MTFAEWFKAQGMSMDNPLMPLVRDAWVAGGAHTRPEVARIAALEEAAKLCESFSGRAIHLTKEVPDAFIMCANAIRRLLPSGRKHMIEPIKMHPACEVCQCYPECRNDCPDYLQCVERMPEYAERVFGPDKATWPEKVRHPAAKERSNGE